MLAQLFIKNISDQKLFGPKDRLVLAVSGGVDSVVLCELCHRAGLRFEIAHANFQLRGDESEADESFVKNLAYKYQVPLHVRKFDTEAYAAQNKTSIQVAARELRYSWFNELLQSNPGYLLTAHHADDNIETVLMNFFRGTGINGLRGIMPKNEKIIRPLLPFSKEQILRFANDNQLEWREDSSNSSDKYSRNYFRNAIIPMVKRIFPEVETNLTDNIKRFAEIETLYNETINQHKKELLVTRGNEVHIPILKLKKAKSVHTILYEIIKPYNFTAGQLSEVVHLLEAEQGKYVPSSTHRIIKNRDWLIISPKSEMESAHIVIDEGEKIARFENGRLILTIDKPGNILFDASMKMAQLDLGNITFPLILRKWKQGDYFYPLGMPKKKKIARFLIDNKVSPTEKEKVWVIESGKRICWVAGMRIDDRFKIGDHTKKVLTIVLEAQ